MAFREQLRILIFYSGS